jgi:glyoxylase-like metal-dependent hydrolase (beta-lactamase superfamily II)
MAKVIYRRLEIMPFGTNCYLVGASQSKQGMVIDPAGDTARILDNIRELDLTIELIVATHIHPDHVGAVRAIKEATGARFAVHSAEAELIPRYDYSRLAAFDSSYSAPPQPDMLLNDGDVIPIGEVSFKVLHTPGHSPGGICLVGYGLVFSGDALFQMSIGRTDGIGGNHGLLISSIRTKLMVLPDATVVLPGHGPKTTIGFERQNNPFLR